MNNEWQLCELDDFGVLRLRGPEGLRFLQGQVSNDVEQLTPERSQLAGYHNPQGRAIAVLRLLQLAPDDLLAILPRELASAVASRLGKFILRTKVKIADESGEWRVTGLIAPHIGGTTRYGAGRTAGASREPGASSASTAEAHGEKLAPELEARAASWAAAQFEEARLRAAETSEQTFAAAHLENADSVVELPTVSALMLPDAVNAQSRSDSTIIVRVGATPARWLIISPAGEETPLSGCKPAGRDAWRLLDIADGIPQIYAATSEEFVAQMLNLDALGGISFEKGCYTGQEVVARAHYRGRVKRRLQRFMSRAPAKLAVGESGQLADGRTFKVVEAAPQTNGRCEFLAVAPIVTGAPGTDDARAGSETQPATIVSGAAVPPGTAAAAAALPVASSALDAEPLPLPYALPE
jgi:tRNA-modifying protein YgfZ